MSILLALLLNVVCGRCFVALVECPTPLTGFACGNARPVDQVEAP